MESRRGGDGGSPDEQINLERSDAGRKQLRARANVGIIILNLLLLVKIFTLSSLPPREIVLQAESVSTRRF